MVAVVVVVMVVYTACCRAFHQNQWAQRVRPSTEIRGDIISTVTAYTFTEIT